VRRGGGGDRGAGRVDGEAVAAVEPKLTPLASVKSVPVVVTVVPPESGPTAGLTALMVGRAS